MLGGGKKIFKKIYFSYAIGRVRVRVALLG
jgi:hypothetical protein